jgi:hypothetical protein
MSSERGVRNSSAESPRVPGENGIVLGYLKDVQKLVKKAMYWSLHGDSGIASRHD